MRLYVLFHIPLSAPLFLCLPLSLFLSLSLSLFLFLSLSLSLSFSLSLSLSLFLSFFLSSLSLSLSCSLALSLLKSSSLYPHFLAWLLPLPTGSTAGSVHACIITIPLCQELGIEATSPNSEVVLRVVEPWPQPMQVHVCRCKVEERGKSMQRNADKSKHGR